MLKGFGNVLVKELKELVRDPKILLGMLIVPLIMFPVLGSVMSFSMQSAAEQAQKAGVLVLNHDEGNYSAYFIRSLAVRMRASNLTDMNASEALKQGLLSKYNATQLIEIPRDFSENMTKYLAGDKNATASVRLYSTFAGAGLLEGIGSSIIDSFAVDFNRQIAPDVLSVDRWSIIKGEIRDVDPRSLTTVMISQAIAMPVTIMILLTYSMQIAATSVAMEKEEKTLETLLTLPMDRFAILMGKLSGSILVAGVGAVAYMIGFNFYVGSITTAIPSTGQTVDLVSLGLAPSIFGYFLLGVSLFVTLLSALALAVVLSAFAEDVRSAQSLVGYIYPFLFVPSLLLMYIDVNALPLAFKIVLYAIPYTHPVLASKAVTMGDYVTPLLGIVYVTAFTLIIMYVASRLFATEKILTAKLKFRGLRRREKTSTES